MRYAQAKESMPALITNPSYNLMMSGQKVDGARSIVNKMMDRPPGFQDKKEICSGGLDVSKVQGKGFEPPNH